MGFHRDLNGYILKDQVHTSTVYYRIKEASLIQLLFRYKWYNTLACDGV